MPEVRRTAKEVVNFIRNPTWIATNLMQEFAGGKFVYSEEKRKEFRENPALHFEMRKKLEHGCVSTFIL